MKSTTRKAVATVPELRCVALVRPGVLACGNYINNVTYWLPQDEAAHLVEHKGFIDVTDAQQPDTNADQEH